MLFKCKTTVMSLLCLHYVDVVVIVAMTMLSDAYYEDSLSCAVMHSAIVKLNYFLVEANTLKLDLHFYFPLQTKPLKVS